MATNETRINGWTFRRVSAAYIDVFPPNAPSYAVDCINVYDYEKGESTVPYTRDALRKAGQTWLFEHRAELQDYAAIAR